MDHQKLEQKIVRKPYTLTIIGETIQQLEGLQYATELDLKMGYYTIDISAESLKLTTIVTGFGKFRYYLVPMGMWAFGDIFQDKVGDILGDTERVKAYIDNILVIGKVFFLKYRPAKSYLY